MPFIGTQPDVGGYSVLDALTASATASYTLQLNSANFVPSSANQLLVSLNGVIQKPGTSFTVSGSTLTFSSALTSSDSIDFILAMGEPLLVGTPSDGAVNTAQLANDAVTGAKIENNPTIAGNLTVSGNTAASGTLTSTGLITASAGVAIGGTGAANTLDDYEEGSWTPAAVSAGSLTNAQGRYTKIGNSVFIRLYIPTITNTTDAGAFDISGLPFTPVTSGTMDSNAGPVMIRYVDVGVTEEIGTVSYVSGGSTTMRFYCLAAGGTYVPIAHEDFNNGGVGIRATLQYETT